MSELVDFLHFPAVSDFDESELVELFLVVGTRHVCGLVLEFGLKHFLVKMLGQHGLVYGLRLFAHQERLFVKT
jgi:hypothetical protein